MNKYLEKIAGFSGLAGDLAKGWKNTSATSKLGLAMSGTGLGLGVANYRNSLDSKHRGHRMEEVESQSLRQLQDISGTLKKRQQVNVKVEMPNEKRASLAEALKDAAKFSRNNPFTTTGAIAGAYEGGTSTTRKPDETYASTVIRGVKNTAIGAISGAALGDWADKGYNKYIKN
jgi:hypothetical protein